MIAVYTHGGFEMAKKDSTWKFVAGTAIGAIIGGTAWHLWHKHVLSKTDEQRALQDGATGTAAGAGAVAGGAIAAEGNVVAGVPNPYVYIPPPTPPPMPMPMPFPVYMPAPAAPAVPSMFGADPEPPPPAPTERPKREKSNPVDDLMHNWAEDEYDA